MAQEARGQVVGRTYGWLRPQPSHRLLAASRQYGAGVTPQAKGFAVPAMSDNIATKGPVFDQGSVGDCTANAGVGAYMGTRSVFGMTEVMFSRLDLYARTRKNIMGLSLIEDSGATITDMIMALEKCGVCREATSPSINPQINYIRDPSAAADAEAAQNKVLRGYSLSTLDWLKASLAERFQFAFGFTVPQHFGIDTDKTGQLRKPEIGEPFEGGHAVRAYAHDDSHDNQDGTVGAFLATNSWGEDFGLKQPWRGHDRRGDFWIGYWWFTHLLAQDMWTIHQVAA